LDARSESLNQDGWARNSVDAAAAINILMSPPRVDRVRDSDRRAATGVDSIRNLRGLPRRFLGRSRIAGG
jgi:hypothetical protein